MVLFSYQRLAAICFLLRSLTGASTLMKSTTVASVPADVLVGPSVALIGKKFLSNVKCCSFSLTKRNPVADSNFFIPL